MSQIRRIKTSFYLLPHREEGRNSDLLFDIRVEQEYEVLEVEYSKEIRHKANSKLVSTQELGSTFFTGVKAASVMPILQAVAEREIEFYPPKED